MSRSPYTWFLLAGIFISILYWRRNFPRRPGMAAIYFGGLSGAFFGAKVVYILSEGFQYWHDPNRWLILATGKTIIGALLGGYAGVEIAKKWVGRREATGDWFATIAPVSIILGRLGCLAHGCCLGVECKSSWYTMLDRDGISRWPAVPLEILFNLAALATFSILRRRKLFPGQHFHFYLIGYGAFRFAHEFARETPRILGPLTGYQIASLAAIALGVIRFRQRQIQQISNLGKDIPETLPTAPSSK